MNVNELLDMIYGALLGKRTADFVAFVRVDGEEMNIDKVVLSDAKKRTKIDIEAAPNLRQDFQEPDGTIRKGILVSDMRYRIYQVEDSPEEYYLYVQMKNRVNPKDAYLVDRLDARVKGRDINELAEYIWANQKVRLLEVLEGRIK